MPKPSVDDLLSSFTSEQLSDILAEELEAAGIPYTRDPADKFEFAPIE